MGRLLKHMASRLMISLVDEDPDITFSTVWTVDRKPGSKYVYRAAAVYYDINQRKTYGMNHRISRSIKKSDAVVYQSEFSRQMCEGILRVSNSNSWVINNGFDTGEFVNVKSYVSKRKLFMASGNWNKISKRLLYIVRGYLNAKIPSELLLFGNMSDANLKKIYKLVNTFNKGKRKITFKHNRFKFKNCLIRIFGNVGFVQMVKYLKAKPVIIHLCYAEACSNSVIEALNFSCPVVCNNIGSTPEIVNKDGVIAQCDKPFEFSRRKIDYRINPVAVSRAMRAALRKKWNIKRPDLSMETCANKYLSVFESVLNA
jgi:glycosyltransferase involved in cell wall biosynthesis